MHHQRLTATVALLLPLPASAHGFGALYTLPVPLWLYGWASAATLVLSFLIAGLFLTAPAHPANAPGRSAWHIVAPRAVLAPLQWLGVALLLLCIVAGFIGHRDPLRNFSTAFFWIIFTLLIPYLTLLLGNFYAVLSPWRTLAHGIGRLWPAFLRGRIAYPAWLADWPALALYLGFIGIELLGSGRPIAVAQILVAYTALNLAGVWLIGARAWFRHCELFAVFLRLIALMAPLRWHPRAAGTSARISFRWPCAGLLSERPSDLSTVTFALAMLATTAFDGLKATQWWVSLFWSDPTGLLTAMYGVPPINALAQVRPWFLLWESLWLVASPFLYLGAYLLALWVARKLTATRRTLRQLALDFGYSLLPIAVVYHLTHYATLLLAHGLKILSLASDPFGWKWNLFGTTQMFRAPILVDMGVVWHSQVGLIVLGHIVSVSIAHRIALRVFPSRAKALLSQLPMLALMIAFTVAGLWILSQPLTVMLMR